MNHTRSTWLLIPILAMLLGMAACNKNVPPPPPPPPPAPAAAPAS